VTAQRVDSHRFGVDETLFEELGARRPTLLLGMPIPIERSEEEEGLAVERESTVFGRERTKPDDAMKRIGHLAIANKFDDKVIELRFVRRPWLRRRDAQLEFEVPPGQSLLALHRCNPFAEGGDTKTGVFRTAK